MILKIIGVAMILISCVAIGAIVKYRHSCYQNELSNLISCLEIIRNEICISYSDILTVFSKSTDNFTSSNQKIFNNFLNTYKTMDGAIISEIWSNSLNDIKDNTIYNSEDIEMLRKFGTLIGTGDINTQKNIIDMLKEDINERLQVLKKNDEKIKMFSKLIIYIGFILMIFLI